MNRTDLENAVLARIAAAWDKAFLEQLLNPTLTDLECEWCWNKDGSMTVWPCAVKIG